MRALVRGSGVAACTTVHLLRRAGLTTSWDLGPTRSSSLSAVLIEKTSQSILLDIFEDSRLFENLPVIRRRVVSWEPGAEPVSSVHDAVVVSELELASRLGGRPDPGPWLKPDWFVYGSDLITPYGQEDCFGTRHATTAEAGLTGAQADTCYMESVSGGWLFLIPRDALTGCVVGCGAPLANLLEESLLIGPKVELGAPPSSKAGAFRSFPRIRHPLAGDDWIACGSAAMSLDPISGSGTGHAACEGILAAAALKAIATGEHPDGLLNHYRARLMAAFHRHLEACIEAHQSARHATRWADELALLNTGLHWTRRQVASIPQSSYVLRAMDLVAVPATRVTSST